MRTIFHIDVNSAFLSWTSVENLKTGKGPDLREIPAIIGGDQKTRHGVVLAKSIPAKKFGIHTGEPVVNALRKCPNLVTAPPDHDLYHEYSHRMMDFLHSLTPDIEQVSIDECFLDFTGIAHRYASPYTAAKYIKDEIHSRFGFTVNVGISSNKLLAKMASDFEKPDKIHTLFPDEIPQKNVAASNRRTVHGWKIFRKSPEQSRYPHHRRTCRLQPETDHPQSEKPWNHALELCKRHRQQSGLFYPAEAKGIGNSTTLSSDLTKESEAVPILHSLAESVASRLRKAHKKAGSICVEIKYYDFQSVSRQTQIDIPTNSTDQITQISKRLFHELWNRQPVRLLGIRTTKLVDENEPVQLSLFDLDFSDTSADKTNQSTAFPKKPSPEKQKKLDAALDSIRKKYGKKAVTKSK